jgi:phosphatidylinositol 3-kinase
MAYGPSHELSAEEKDLIWKFRHHLTRDKRVRCVISSVI